MDQIEANLGDVPTRWSIVLKAQQTTGDTAAAARNELLVRYHEAVQRYLRVRLGDDNVAGQLYSDFAVRVLQADPFLKRADPARAADPQRGCFRFYLMAVLGRMVMDHYRACEREGRKRRDLGDHEPADYGDEAAGDDAQFTDCWRQELINQAWQALQRVEEKTGQPYATLVRLQQENPGLRSAQLAECAAARLGRPLTAANVRQIVHRGREKFGQLLLEEVARSLRSDPADKVAPARLEQELIDLGLLFDYCKTALEQYIVSA